MVGEGMELAPSKPSPTRRMRLALGGAVVLFGAIVATQAVLHVVVVVVAALVAGASEILLRTGGLDTQTFETSLYVGLGLVIALMLGLQGRAFVHSRRGSRTDESSQSKSPVVVAAVILLLALVAVTLLGWHRSAFFPYPLATVVVIANLAFFGIAAPAWIGRLAFRWTCALFEIGSRSQYVAGAMTAALILMSAGALWSANVEHRVVLTEISDVRMSGRLEQSRAPTSLADASEEGLCIVGNALQPELATRSVGCGFTAKPGGAGGWGDDGGRPSDDCVKTLHDTKFQSVQTAISKRYGLSAYDANEVTVRALLLTCAKDPPPRNPGGYFWTVANNEAARFFPSPTQLGSCDELANVADTCTTEDSEENAAEKAHALWRRAECELGSNAMQVITLYLVDDLTFAEIGERIGVPEARARDMYYNAIKRIRRTGIADCFRE